MDDKCLIICIVDRSGSMESLREEAISGFNGFLKEQQALPGEAMMTLMLFNHRRQIVHEYKQLDKVEPLTEDTYVPMGTTALLDAVGMSIDTEGKRLAGMNESNRPNKVMVVIFTDGLENSSVQYSYQQIKDNIEHQRSVYKWEFLFLAANMDVMIEADKLGIPQEVAMSFDATPQGVASAYASASASTARFRAGE